MFVSIPYIRRRLKPLGDSLTLTLKGISHLEFIDFDGTKSSLKEEIEIGSPYILSTDSEVMPIKIETTMGQLILEFQEISFNLDTGQVIEFDDIKKEAENYWTEWQADSGSK